MGSFWSHQLEYFLNLFLGHNRAYLLEKIGEIIDVKDSVAVLVKNLKDNLLSGVIALLLLRQCVVDSPL
jgi:hypothetical protein